MPCAKKTPQNNQSTTKFTLRPAPAGLFFLDFLPVPSYILYSRLGKYFIDKYSYKNNTVFTDDEEPRTARHWPARGRTGERERRKYPNSKPQAPATGGGSGKAHHGRGRRRSSNTGPAGRGRGGKCRRTPHERTLFHAGNGGFG